MKALRYAEYGPASVLEILEIPIPPVGPGEVQVRVIAAGLNPVDFLVRQGLRQETFPLALPTGIGSDFSGVVSAVAPNVEKLRVGDPVFGSTALSSLAELVVVGSDQLTIKPLELGWDVAATLGVSGITAHDALASQSVTAADTVLVSAAAGGVGILLGQLARRTGAAVVGSASTGNHALLRDLGMLPVSYGPGLVAEIRRVAPQGVTVAFDQWGDEAIEAAIELGVARHRINTVAVDPTPYGVRRVGRQSPNPHVLDELARLVVAGELIVPIDSVFEFNDYIGAFERAEGRHVHGKVVIRL